MLTRLKVAACLALLLGFTIALGSERCHIAFHRLRAAQEPSRGHILQERGRIQSINAGRIRFQRGNDALKAGHYLDAVGHYETVLRQAPDLEPMWTRNNLGCALDQLQRFGEAATLYQEALTLPVATHDLKLYRNAVANAISRSDVAAAGHLAAVGLRVFPEDPALQDSVNWALAQKAHALAQSAQTALAAEQWERAVTELKEMLRTAPAIEPEWARTSLAYALDQLHRYDEAAKLYMDVLSLHPPAFPSLYLHAAQNVSRRLDAPETIRIATLGTLNFPKEPWLWEKLGWAYRQAGDVVRANQSFDAATNLVFQGEVLPCHETALSLPFRGAWLVIGGNGDPRSHRGLRNQFAWDFMAVDANLQTSSGDGSRNEHHHAFGKEICAPAEGTVIEVVDHRPDQAPLEKLPSNRRAIASCCGIARANALRFTTSSSFPPP